MSNSIWISTCGIGLNGSFSLSATGTPYHAYALKTAPDLASPIIWTANLTNTADSNGLLSFTEPTATNHVGRFYRVQSQ